jgi:hypothetical protein
MWALNLSYLAYTRDLRVMTLSYTVFLTLKDLGTNQGSLMEAEIPACYLFLVTVLGSFLFVLKNFSFLN